MSLFFRARMRLWEGICSKVFVLFSQRKWAGLSIGQEIDGKSDGSTVMMCIYKS